MCVWQLESGEVMHSLQDSGNISNTSNTNSVHSIVVSANGKVVTSYENG